MIKIIDIKCQGSKTSLISELEPFQGNLKDLSDVNYAKLRGEILRLGFSEPVSVWLYKGHKYILNGHQRVRTVSKMIADEGYECPPIPINIIEAKNKKEAKQKVLALTSQYGQITDQGLYEFLSTSDIGFEEVKYNYHFPEINTDSFIENFYSDTPITNDDLDNDVKKDEPELRKLSEDFLIAPFSVFNAREGFWQDRKKAWMQLGIVSQIGREDTLLDYQRLSKQFGNRSGSNSDTSIFDPVICEIAYSWFAKKGYKVLDPFAGGSVRGLTAAHLGLEYHGIDLRPEQIEANNEQLVTYLQKNNPAHMPTWYEGDSTKDVKGLPDEFDLIFSCPPYGHLEKYSDNPDDLSNLNPEDFEVSHKKAIQLACNKLKEDRFAFYVVGDYRDKKGYLSNFVSNTISHFIDAGLQLYNEGILITPLGSLPVRVRNYMEKRKLGKTHQNILVFIKGCPRKASANLGALQLNNIAAEINEQ